MRHIMIEYSSNLADGISVKTLVEKLHRAILDSGLFETSAVRTRALPRDIYVIADGNPQNVFLHVIARIRAGRSVDVRKALGNSLLQTAKDVLTALPPSTPLALGVEVHEIDPEMLFRHITIK